MTELEWIVIGMAVWLLVLTLYLRFMGYLKRADQMMHDALQKQRKKRGKK